MGNPGDNLVEENKETLQASKDNLLWQMIANQARVNAQLFSLSDLIDLRDRFSRSDAIMPMVDPTSYRKGMSLIERNRRLLNATIEYVTVLNELKALEERKTNASDSVSAANEEPDHPQQ